MTKLLDKKWILVAGNVFFGLIYFLIAHQSLKLATINSHVSPIWPPTGFAIALLLFLGPRLAPSILLGAFFANLLAQSPAIVAILIAFGNMLEALLGFGIYTYIMNRRQKLEHLTDALAILVAALFGPAVSASVGILTLTVTGVIEADIMRTAWLTWWIGDVIGALVILPLANSIRSRSFSDLKEFFRINPGPFAVGLLLSLYSFGLVAYVLMLPNSLKYIFLLFPLLANFTIIRNRLFLSLCSLFLSVEVVWITLKGAGPFNLSSMNQNLLNLEIFLTAVVITFIVLASVVHIRIRVRTQMILLVGWILWGAIFYNIQRGLEVQDREQFDQVTNEIELRIQERMQSYIEVVSSGRSLFAANPNVGPEEWHRFIESLGIQTRTPGINGVGVVKKVKRSEIDKHIASHQNPFGKKYNYRRLPSSVLEKELEHSFIISAIEPLEPNRAALGLDLASESRRREAALRSMETGNPSLTQAIQLVQDTGSRPGFLLFQPVYKNGMPTATAEERKKSFSHWVYAPFVATKFFESVFTQFKTNYIFRIYESVEANTGSLIYASSNEPVNGYSESITRPFFLAGQKFLVKWAKKHDFSSSHNLLSTWIGFVGSMSVLIVMLFIISLQAFGDRAKDLAEALHRDFLEAQSRVKVQEAKIVESSKMASLGEMAGSIAHEINNPLAIILGKAQRIGRYCEKVDFAKHHDDIRADVTKITNTVDRISKIIKGLRQFARDASSDPMSEIQVPELIEDTISFCQERFQNSNVDLRVKIEYEGSLFCRGTEISQVLLNLINNAFDAIHTQPQAWVELKASQHEEFVQFSITDCGMGISSELQKKIFTPFFTTKEVGKGTGLGLSISRGIIESHLGQFTLDTANKNTCFIFRIPIRPSNSNQDKVV